jgi:hypothetical protein
MRKRQADSSLLRASTAARWEKLSRARLGSE